MTKINLSFQRIDKGIKPKNEISKIITTKCLIVSKRERLSYVNTLFRRHIYTVIFFVTRAECRIEFSI